MTKIILCIDGLGKDMLTKESMPFLYRFGKDNNLLRLKTLFAFTGIEYCFFTGKTPEETGIWLEFIYSKDSLFNNLVLKFFSLNKKFRDYLAGLMQLMKGRTWISGLHNIPKKRINYFDSSIKTGLWKLPYFQKRSFAFYKWPFFVTKNGKEKIKLVFRYENDEKRLKRLMEDKGKEIYCTQLMSVDKTVHKFGKSSEKTKEILRKLDKTLEFYIRRILKENKNAEIFVWGDHGFADIKNYIDLERLLPRREDYIYFIAGTTASFWFGKGKEEIKRVILRKIKKYRNIKILDKKIARKYNIPLLRKYGDLILFLEKGNYFFPNFYQKNEKEKFLSMHGYPEDEELDGFLIANSGNLKKKSLKIREVRRILDD
jgi:predicted AlkP superfamily pyrophosphatase or phosphodiesterase